MTNFDKHFPDLRETGENNLRQSQLVMLRMLKILDFLCEKYEIDYFLIGGSLLGAVRHGGFIPWDDDLDIGMTRPNYQKFLSKAIDDLPFDIFFQNSQTDPYYPKFDHVDARLRDRYSSYSRSNGLVNKWHEGLQIDIFVYDKGYLPSKMAIILQNRLIKVFTRNSNQRPIVLDFFDKMLPIRSVYCNNWLNNFGMLKFGPNFFFESEISETESLKFEDMFARVPKNFHNPLKRQYGDYMLLPPQEKQVSNHDVVSQPFTPCVHSQSLNWTSRNNRRF
jgi:lipopolysaccharide cholinephosphotransferase